MAAGQKGSASRAREKHSSRPKPPHLGNRAKVTSAVNDPQHFDAIARPAKDQILVKMLRRKHSDPSEHRISRLDLSVHFRLADLRTRPYLR